MATGAIPGSGGNIDACYNDGALRVIDKEKGAACSKGWIAISFNQQGVPG